MDYDSLIAAAADKLKPGCWLPVLSYEDGHLYFAVDIPGERAHNREPHTAQSAALLLANQPPRRESVYVLHCDQGGQVSVHLPGWRDATGEWYPERSYLTPLYVGGEQAARAVAVPGPRARLSSLAARRDVGRLRLATD